MRISAASLEIFLLFVFFWMDSTPRSRHRYKYDARGNVKEQVQQTPTWVRENRGKRRSWSWPATPSDSPIYVTTRRPVCRFVGHFIGGELGKDAAGWWSTLRRKDKWCAWNPCRRSPRQAKQGKLRRERLLSLLLLALPPLQLHPAASELDPTMVEVNPTVAEVESTTAEVKSTVAEVDSVHAEFDSTTTELDLVCVSI